MSLTVILRYSHTLPLSALSLISSLISSLFLSLYYISEFSAAGVAGIHLNLSSSALYSQLVADILYIIIVVYNIVLAEAHEIASMGKV